MCIRDSCDTVLSAVYFIFGNITCRGIEIPQGLLKEGKKAAMSGVDKMTLFSDSKTMPETK